MGSGSGRSASRASRSSPATCSSVRAAPARQPRARLRRHAHRSTHVPWRQPRSVRERGVQRCAGGQAAAARSLAPTPFWRPDRRVFAASTSTLKRTRSPRTTSSGARCTGSSKLGNGERLVSDPAIKTHDRVNSAVTLLHSTPWPTPAPSATSSSPMDPRTTARRARRPTDASR